MLPRECSQPVSTGSLLAQTLAWSVPIRPKLEMGMAWIYARPDELNMARDLGTVWQSTAFLSYKL
jgi:hypothetical protein